MLSKTSFTTRAVCILLAALVVLSLLIRTPYFVIINTKNNEVLFVAGFSEGEIFSISYTHSLHQTPVQEIYRRYRGELHLVSIEFESFGAGLPDVLEDGQTLTRLETGGMRIDGINRLIPDLHILIGYATDHILHIFDQDIPLESLDCPGQSLHLTFRQLNLLQRLYYRLLLKQRVY